MWKDKIRAEHLAEEREPRRPEAKEKVSFEEIKELEEEYIYASGIISVDNTDRMLSNTSSLLGRDLNEKDGRLSSAKRSIKEVGKRKSDNLGQEEPPSDIGPHSFGGQLSRMYFKTEEKLRADGTHTEPALLERAVLRRSFGQPTSPDAPDQNLSSKENAENRHSPGNSPTQAGRAGYHLKKLYGKTKSGKTHGTQDNRRKSLSPERRSPSDPKLTKARRDIKKAKSQSEFLDSFENSEFKPAHKQAPHDQPRQGPKILKKVVSNKNLGLRSPEIKTRALAQPADTKVNFFSQHSKTSSYANLRQDSGSSFCKNLKVSFSGYTDARPKGQITGKKLLVSGQKQGENSGLGADLVSFSKRSEEQQKKGRPTHSGSISRPVEPFKGLSFKSPSKLKN